MHSGQARITGKQNIMCHYESTHGKLWAMPKANSGEVRLLMFNEEHVWLVPPIALSDDKL